jgi:hypothetical protein
MLLAVLLTPMAPVAVAALQPEVQAGLTTTLTGPQTAAVSIEPCIAPAVAPPWPAGTAAAVLAAAVPPPPAPYAAAAAFVLLDAPDATAVLLVHFAVCAPLPAAVSVLGVLVGKGGGSGSCGPMSLKSPILETMNIALAKQKDTAHEHMAEDKKEGQLLQYAAINEWHRQGTCMQFNM